MPLAVVLDHLPYAVIFVRRGGEVVHMNRRAERLVATRDGLVIRRSRLSVLDRREGKALRLLIEDAAGTGDGRPIGIGGACRLPRPSRKRAYEVLVVPLRRYGGTMQIPWTGAILFITDPAAAVRLSVRRLTQLYGLTPTEAALAVTLVGGTTVNEIAEERSVSIRTVRAQLSNLLAKTGTRRQAELVRRLLRGPAGLSSV